MKRYRYLLLFTGCFLACSGVKRRAVTPGHPLLGRWKYADCTVKNTSVRGTIEFRDSGRMILNVTARDDCPTPDIRGRYRYSIKTDRITTSYTIGYGLASFFLVKGDSLYLSRRPITRPIAEGFGVLRRANWTYRLVRVK